MRALVLGEKAGYSPDEYGQHELADNDIHQSAGDGDEGIMRNAMGLHHSLGVLVETAVTADPRNTPLELVSAAAVMRRRVAAHKRSLGAAFVPMGQPAEPVIALLLDGRGLRHSVEGEPLSDC